MFAAGVLPFLLMGLGLAFLFNGDDDDGAESGPSQDLTEGDDTYTLRDEGVTDLFALAGDDTLTIETESDTRLSLGAGDDDVTVTEGAATIFGDAGDDRVTHASDDPLKAYLGGGDDTLTATGTGRIDAIGGAGSDLIEGGPKGDDLSGGAGTDTVSGNGGDDLLFIGTGQDLLIGGAGNDFYEMDGNDFEHGALIHDRTEEDEAEGRGDYLATFALTDTLSVVYSGNGNAVVSGGGFAGSTQMAGVMGLFHAAETDHLFDARSETEDTTVIAFTRDAAHTIYGGEGDDSLQGGDFDDPSGTLIDGGAGDDTVGGYGTLIGGTGNDFVNGTGTLSGGIGDDSLQGHGALFGDVGADTLATQGFVDDVQTEATELSGGDGIDRFVLSAELDTFDFPDPFFAAPVITDFEPGETIAIDIYHDAAAMPALTIEEDAIENEVRILVNGTLALTVDGVSTLPPDTVALTFEVIPETSA